MTNRPARKFLGRAPSRPAPRPRTSYLFGFAGRYFTFCEECPGLKAETEEPHSSRLLLRDLMARTIRKGTELLGIAVVDKM